MRRCTYCGKKYDDMATVCVIDRQPVVEAHPKPERSSKQSEASLEFPGLLFESPREEEFAVRCAQFLTRFVGGRITLLRPDTKWSEIIKWSGPSFFHAAALGMALEREFGVDAKRIFSNREFTTFRDLVEYVFTREDKAA
jgi:hypothetical protein